MSFLSPVFAAGVFKLAASIKSYQLVPGVCGACKTWIMHLLLVLYVRIQGDLLYFKLQQQWKTQDL